MVLFLREYKTAFLSFRQYDVHFNELIHLYFKDIQKLTKSNQKDMLSLLYKMESDKLINVNEEKKIVILTRR